VTEADLAEYRRERARTAWKYAMWDAACQMPTQLPNGGPWCICGAAVWRDGATVSEVRTGE
jgi:hypothetical protein